jgi:hypothetical protein
MKHLKSINEFFDFLKKDSEEDKIAIQFIQRLERVKDKNPYKISIISGDDLAKYGSQSYQIGYEVIFDDVLIKVYAGHFLSPGGLNTEYEVEVNNDTLYCKKSYRKKILGLSSSIYSRFKNKERLNRMKTEINPAADLLNTDI